jgi:hypothetical protein
MSLFFPPSPSPNSQSVRRAVTVPPKTKYSITHSSLLLSINRPPLSPLFLCRPFEKSMSWQRRSIGKPAIAVTHRNSAANDITTRRASGASDSRRSASLVRRYGTGRTSSSLRRVSSSSLLITGLLLLLLLRVDAARQNDDGQMVRRVRVLSHPTRVRALPPPALLPSYFFCLGCNRLTAESRRSNGVNNTQ